MLHKKLKLMFEFYNEKLEELNQDLSSILLMNNNKLSIHKQAIELCINTLHSVKKHFNDLNTLSAENEIYFFKEIKPLFMSKLIYHIGVFNIESLLPNGGKKSKIKYYKKHLKAGKNFFKSNKTFYKYYRTQSSYLDEKFFTRNNYDINLNVTPNLFEFDPDFSTSHDHIVSQILAYDLLQFYIEEKLSDLKFGKTPIRKNVPKNDMNWTGSKIALIELIYALHSSGSINNGTADIKEIAKVTAQIFKVDLGNYYHTFAEIKSRKTNQTKYLDSLKESLINYIKKSDL